MGGRREGVHPTGQLVVLWFLTLATMPPLLLNVADPCLKWIFTGFLWWWQLWVLHAGGCPEPGRLPKRLQRTDSLLAPDTSEQQQQLRPRERAIFPLATEPKPASAQWRARNPCTTREVSHANGQRARLAAFAVTLEETPLVFLEVHTLIVPRNLKHG